jgi:2,4'-dihydroxyacetophenone dioxygenase
MSTVSERRGDEAAIPYQLPQPASMSSDIDNFGLLNKWLEDDNLWVPMTRTIRRSCL